MSSDNLTIVESVLAFMGGVRAVSYNNKYQLCFVTGMGL